jgi:hypothetical protein
VDFTLPPWGIDRNALFRGLMSRIFDGPVNFAIRKINLAAAQTLA